MADYKTNLHAQMLRLEAKCVEYHALPLILVCMDGNKGGHMFWPDELPPEIVKALPFLLDDVRESLTERPLT